MCRRRHRSTGMAWKVLALCIIVSHCRLSYSCSTNCTGRQELLSRPQEVYINAIKCHTWCIEQYDIELPVTTRYSVWPTRNITALERDCYHYQKVEQCMIGCSIKLVNRSMSVNTCRSNCCDDTCETESDCLVPNSNCPRKCRTTFCRKGCEIPEGWSENRVVDTISPLSGPVLTRVPQTTDYTVTVPPQGIPSIDMPSNGSSAVGGGVVNFIFKVTDVDDNVTWFYWQTDLSQPLKLTAFNCRNVEVSFAVINSLGMSHYSPPRELCVHPMTQYPTPIDRDAITLSYEEDRREGYLGYSRVTVYWSRPQGYEYVESYSVYVLSTSLECGGRDSIYDYHDIPKSTTNWTLVANQTNGYLKYGCSYKLRMEAHPTNYETNNQITFVPRDDRLLPDINITCEMVDQTSDILIKWSITNTTYALQDTVGNFAIIASGSVHLVPTEKGKLAYSFVLPNPTIGIQSIKLRSLQNANYYWRSVPSERTCRVDIGNVTNNNGTDRDQVGTNTTVTTGHNESDCTDRSSNDNRTITVYYEDSSTRSKILELNCVKFEQQALEERLTLLTHNISEAVAARMEALEDKIDKLLSLLTTNSSK